MKKSLLLVAVILSAFSLKIFAHVVVKPAEVGIGAFTNFTMGVPVEKEIPTTQVRLVIPDGLQYVTPYVKQGWKVEVKKTGEGEEAKVTEITWSGNQIPAGFKDDFLFSAKTPSTETSLQWKAYQIYSDGTVVSWDQDANSASHNDEVTPFSVTKVKNDLTATNVTPAPTNLDAYALGASMVAIVVSIGTLILLQRKLQ